jgi:hypothetical protein
MLTDADCNSDRIDAELSRLEKIKTNWLENPQPDYGGRTPANIIKNERRRLPLALGKREMIIDEDCYTCMMIANDPTGSGLLASGRLAEYAIGGESLI